MMAPHQQSDQPLLSVILVSYNTRDLTDQCLTELKEKLGSLDAEIVVVDNASSDGSVAMIRARHPDVKCVASPVNLGFARGNKVALPLVNGEFILLLNTDAFVFADTIPVVIRELQRRPDAGIAGVRLITETGESQPSARYQPGMLRKLLVMSGLATRLSGQTVSLGYDYPEARLQSVTAVDWVPGAFFMIRHELIREIGFLDEGYFMYFEEVDFCMRAKKAGWKTIFIPGVSAIHLGGVSSKKTSMAVSKSGSQLIAVRIASEYRFYARYRGRLAAWINLQAERMLRLIIAWKKDWHSTPQAREIAAAERFTAGCITEFLQTTGRVSK